MREKESDTSMSLTEQPPELTPELPAEVVGPSAPGAAPRTMQQSCAPQALHSERSALEILQRMKEINQRWRDRNREKLRAPYKHYNALPQSKESKRRYRDANREKASTYARERRRNLKERAAEELRAQAPAANEGSASSASSPSN